MELWTLLVSSFLAATILPLASEIPLAVVVRRHGDVLLPVTIATLGNYLGACTTYAIVLVAGAAGVRFLPFSAWTVSGKAARYAAVAWLALRV